MVGGTSNGPPQDSTVDEEDEEVEHTFNRESRQ
jgi:hypothetical protein